MNNLSILLVAIIVLFIGYVECYNDEDMALFFLGCLICVPAILISGVGIVMNKNFFEC